MTGLMEIFQIKGIIPHLIDSLNRKFALPHFEFQHKNDGLNDENNIDFVSPILGMEYSK